MSFEKYKPIYIKISDEEVDILSAFKRDFPTDFSITNIGNIVEQLVKQQKTETITLKNLYDQNGYSVQITRSLEYMIVKTGILKNQTKGVLETPHPIEIRRFKIDTNPSLTINPTPGRNYNLMLDLYDPAGDLNSFLVAIDGRFYRKGSFIRHPIDVTDGKTTTTELNFLLCGSILKGDEILLRCRADDDGIYGYSGSGYGTFGDIPIGEKHEIMIYTVDDRGNRSFAGTSYKI